jgi:serine/threonine-protein phosphatase 2A regulatory subunit B
VVLPKLQHFQTVTTATPKREFPNAHTYLINSISMNPDGECFISADDLGINLWNIEHKNTCFNFLDMKPAHLAELTEVITTASFHPTHCNVLMYGSSRGALRLCDMRESALCDNTAKVFRVEADPAETSFFTEIVSAISDAQFSHGGRYIVTRDFLTLKVWDVNMEREPVLVVPVHDYLRQHFVGLYENDCIFDKFSVCSAGDGRFCTGSYHNRFLFHNMNNGQGLSLECMRDPPPRKFAGEEGFERQEEATKNGIPADTEAGHVDLMDFGKKALRLGWHPTLDCLAVAGLNKLYIYQAS